MERNGNAALEHVLQQSDGLQADRFPSRVRPGDDEQSAVAVEREVKGNDLFAGFAVGEEKEGVYGLLPVDQRFIFRPRDNGADAFGEAGFGTNEVDDGKEFVGLDDVRHEGADHVGESGQDADDLASLLGLEFADAVVGFDDGFGLNVDRLTGGRFVVHDAADASLEGGGYGDDESAVAEGGRRVAIHPAFSLRRAEDGL